MNSLVLELQNEALDPSSSVLNLLRKASVIAYKLDVQELQEWVKLELNGYSQSSQLPDYRFVNGELKAQNPFHGFIPVMLDDAKISDLISKRPVFQPISELEHLISNASRNFLHLTFPKEMELEIQKWLRDPLPLVVRVSTSQFNKVVENTRDIILNWSLRLEKDGILGEGMTFSTREKEIAHNASYHIEHLYNYSPIGNTMSETNIDQSNSSMGIGVNQGEVKTEKLAGTINEAQSQNLAQAAADIQQLLEQLSQKYPTETLSQKALVAEEAIKKIENDSSFKQRVISAIKAGSIGALEKAIDNPIGAFFIEGIKGWKDVN
ncbi:hypothetical protein Xen7305DRAFT_00031760 [Xenococcus sp. PCC 7305]|uniref:AbiTii domain-containing protein n=1 Tax=Xenococcus sp. PCC 7305 TaxID=102125 RepID=UPI0002ACE5A3|nr:hypothetical protein [Xenococcus sp. PCC 7305]ELS03452.1 hypothetical protein Xen7305DRAFT_00031760 [Xenococcus sp. PCC 7305]